MSYDYKITSFDPLGSDERQYCSPGFNLPVGSLRRSSPPNFPEYHTSADNTEFVKAKYLADSFSKYMKVILKLEENFGNFYPKNPGFGPKLAPVPSKYKYIYIFYEIYRSSDNVY